MVVRREREREMLALSSRGYSNNTPNAMDFHQDQQPMSRTHQYRKVMKPLLERKRRARINKCLDELKDLMVHALQTEGESIAKLEKADVLELTVRHLRKLKHQNVLGLTPQNAYAGRFRAGYAHCAQEVSQFMVHVPGVDGNVSSRLLSHLNCCIQSMEVTSPPPSVSTKPDSDSTQFSLVEKDHPPPHHHYADEADVALDLSSHSRRDNDNVSSSVRCRQMSNDSDSGNGSSLTSADENEEPKSHVHGTTAVRGSHAHEADKSSWRPW